MCIIGPAKGIRPVGQTESDYGRLARGTPIVGSLAVGERSARLDVASIHRPVEDRGVSKTLGFRRVSRTPGPTVF